MSRIGGLFIITSIDQPRWVDDENEFVLDEELTINKTDSRQAANCTASEHEVVVFPAAIISYGTTNASLTKPTDSSLST